MTNYQPLPTAEQYPPPQHKAPVNRHEGLAVTALVLGILAVVLCWTVLTAWFAIVLGILAIIFGAIGFRPKKGKFGLGLGIVGVAISIVAFAMFAHDVNHALNDSSGTSIDPGVSQGIASQDASRDVTLGPVQAPDAIGMRYEKVTVVNHSSGRSDYMIDVAVQSPDGKTRYDTGSVYITNVEPGQTASDKVMFTKDIPAGAKAVLKTVARTASL